MKKIFGVFIIVLLFLFFLIANVNASNLPIMNLENYNAATNSNTETPTTNEQNQMFSNSQSNTTNQETSDKENSPTIVPKTTSEDDNEFFTVENILSIILIVIGILLILLSIAILIRIKNISI